MIFVIEAVLCAFIAAFGMTFLKYNATPLTKKDSDYDSVCKHQPKSFCTRANYLEIIKATSS
jgi:hypothetical protein